MLMKQYLLVVTLIVLLGLMPRSAWAYGADVHFNLTYVLCRLAGLEAKDALWIADADQSMDDNDVTTCFRIDRLHSSTLSWERNGMHFHDFSAPLKTTVEGTDALFPGVTIRYTDGGAAARAEIIERLSEMFNRVPTSHPQNEQAQILADVAFGQYLHTEQDFFSHRQFTRYYLIPTNSNVKETPQDSFLPYGPRAGHANDGDGHCADYVGLRPALANEMALDCYKHICEYAIHVCGLAVHPVSPANINLLVNDLAKTYVILIPPPLPGVAPTDPALNPSLLVVPPANQKVTNSALKAALLSVVTASGWPDTLPAYGDTDEDIEKFKLPYDTPETPLKEVQKRVEVDLASNH